MSVLPGLRPVLMAAAVLSLSAAPVPAASGIDPAVVGERLERLNAAVEAVEASQSTQRRQIDELGSSLHKIREDLLQQGGQRPWADDFKRHGDDLRRQSEDLKRLAAAIEEVDRKRAADHKQVLEILADLRKAVAAAAEAPPSRPQNRPAPDRTDDSGSGRGSGTRDKPPKPAEAPEKFTEYTVGPGESLSLVVRAFNEEAKKKGYQPVTVQQVMKFNRITDERRVPSGATLKIPLVTKPDRP